MLASFNVSIAHKVTVIFNVCKHYLCIYGKSREENRVQNVCKKTGCANFVQAKVAPDSVQICAKTSDRLCACIHVCLAVTRPDSPEGELTAGGDL
jgi:hypothetical protein